MSHVGEVLRALRAWHGIPLAEPGQIILRPRLFSIGDYVRRAVDPATRQFTQSAPMVLEPHTPLDAWVVEVLGMDFGGAVRRTRSYGVFMLEDDTLEPIRGTTLE